MERVFERGQVAWAASYLITPKQSSMNKKDAYHIDVQAVLDKHGKAFQDIPQDFHLIEGSSILLSLKQVQSRC